MKKRKTTKRASKVPTLHVVKLHTAKREKVIAVVPGGYVNSLLDVPIVKVEPIGPWTQAWRSFVKFLG